MIGYEYGNTRLRVRAGQILGAEDYRALLRSSSLDGMLGALSGGPYRAELESAMTRYSGIRRLDEAVRIHLTTQEGDVLSFYQGEIRDRLVLFQSRWDRRNLRAILRSLGQAARPERPALLLVAAGSLDTAALSEIASQRDVRAAVDLLGVWQLPTASVIRHLRRAMPRYAETGDVGVLELALDQSFGESVAAAGGEDNDDPVLGELRRQIDRINLMSVIRLRQARLGGEVTDGYTPIPGGRVNDAAWTDTVQFDERADVLDRLSGLLPSWWQPPLAAWVEHGETLTLDNRLEAADAHETAVRFRRADPLGIEVPLRYLGRKEAEAKNLRLVARAVAHDVSRQETLEQLLGVA